MPQPQEVKTDVNSEGVDPKAIMEATGQVEGQAKEKKPASNEGVISSVNDLQTHVKSFKLGDIVIPILSIIILVLLTIFVYIPMITQSFDFAKEGSDISKKIAKLDKLSTDLDKMDTVTLQQDLSVSRSVIPFSLQVSSFIAQVDDLAKSKSLSFREIEAGDIQVRSLSDQRNADPIIKGVSGPLKYSGSLTNITSFLDGLKNSSTFLTSTEQVVLRKGSDGSNNWEVSLIVTGYYLDRANLPKPDLYAPFSSYTQYDSIMNIFKQKVESGKTQLILR